MIRAWFACCVLVCASACGLLDPQHAPSIAGTYRLLSVDGQPVPCCTRTDTASGVRTTPLSGQLTLGAAAPESFVAVPAGMYMPSSCVYTIPNGARMHGDTVFTQGGSWYLLAPCGRGSYAMTLTERVDSAGRTDTVAVQSSGRYSWSNTDSAVFLVGSMSGSLTGTGSATHLMLQQTHFGDQPSQDFPQYEFGIGP
ncbi:MAG: hypothetical protein ACYCVL_09505 [Gemmatimonadaceae bacterium]